MCSAIQSALQCDMNCAKYRIHIGCIGNLTKVVESNVHTKVRRVFFDEYEEFMYSFQMRMGITSLTKHDHYDIHVHCILILPSP